MRACVRAGCARCTGRFHPARAAAGRRAAAECPSCNLARSSRQCAAVSRRRARRAAARAAAEPQRRFCQSRRSRGPIGERECCRRRDRSRRRRRFGPPIEPRQPCRDGAPAEQGEWRHLRTPIKQRECREWRRLCTPVEQGERQRVHAPAHERLRWRVPARLGPMGSASRDRPGRVRWAKWDRSTGLRACFRYGAR